MPRRLPRARHQVDPDDPGADDHRARRPRRWSATTSTPTAAAASSTRSAPTRTRRCSTACRSSPGRRRVRPQRRAGRARRRPLRRALRHRQLQRRHGIELQAVAAASSAGSRSSAAAAPCGVRRSARPPGHHQPGAADPRHPGLLAARRRRRADPRRDRARPGARRPHGPAKLHRGEGAHEHDAPTVPPTTSQPLWRRLLLTRETAVIALAGRWSSSTRSTTSPTSTAR